MIDILLIEDDKDLIELYKTEFELLGGTVETAQDGKSGLQLARKHKPDLIVMDVILPEKIGLSILKELKDDADLQSIPVVIMSNYDQGENPRKAVEFGAAAFLSKQKYSPQQLAQEALKVLE